MVEGAVKIVYTNVYAPLRNREFNSLAALNTALQEQRLLLNNKPYKNTLYSRWYFYEQLERSMLKPLPSERFAPKKVVVLTVQRNNHVQLRDDCLYYGVPHQYVGKKVKLLYDAWVVEIYTDYNRIALNARKPRGTSFITEDDHMPPHYRKMKDINGFNKEDILNQAKRIGANTERAAERILDSSVYVEQNYKSCFSMTMLQKKYGPHRLEDACGRALHGSRMNYTMIKNILQNGLDKQPLLFNDHITPDHETFVVKIIIDNHNNHSYF